MSAWLLWGCGRDQVDLDDWVGSDVDDHGQHHVGNILDGLPFPDGHFDGVVCHHALQALRPVDAETALVELRRVCRPGGWLRGTVPDLLAGVAAQSRGDTSWFPGAPDPTEGREPAGRAFHRWVTWFGDNRSVFVRSSLAAVLLHAGWAVLDVRGRPGETCCPDQTILAADGPRLGRADESIWFEATNPEAAA